MGEGEGEGEGKGERKGEGYMYIGAERIKNVVFSIINCIYIHVYYRYYYRYYMTDQHKVNTCFMCITYNPNKSKKYNDCK